MIELTIVVIAYNEQDNIKKCLDSILAQENILYEMLIINDGSTDKTLSVIEKQSERFTSVKVLNQTNKGLSESRNIAFRHCTTKYIMFVDADDWIEPSMSKELVSFSKRNDLDILLSGINIDYVYDDYSVQNKIDLNIVAQNRKEIGDLIFTSLQSSILNYVPTKLYNADFIKKTNEEFDVSAVPGEDIDFNIRVLLHANRVGALSKCYYHYLRLDKPSLVSKYRENYYRIVLMKRNNIEKLFKFYCLDEERHISLKNYLHFTELQVYIINFFSSNSNLLFKQIVNDLRGNIFNGGNYDVVKSVKPKNLYDCIFRFLYLFQNPTFLAFSYQVLSVLKSKFSFFYRKFREIQFKKRSYV